jgi:hypothetical protein
MVERQYGYKTTEVSGSKFTIKEKFEGTALSSESRRLAARDDIAKVHVEHDGMVTVHIRRDDTYNLTDYLPDGFRVVDAMVHEGNGTHAHLDIERVK